MTATPLDETLGFSTSPELAETARARRLDLVNLKLASRGFALPPEADDSPLLDFGRSLLANFEEKMRLLGDSLCPADATIHDFLSTYLAESAAEVFAPGELMIPSGALSLERHGLARELSLPAGRDTFVSSILSSYRVQQGVCHNPAKDRRTTEGVFHIVTHPLLHPVTR
jgi:hypothetical protein